MKEMGGYLDFEINTGLIPHENGIKLNTARNALAYLIEAKRITKINMPSYICSCCVDICKKYDVKVSFYRIDENLKPMIGNTDKDEWVYLVNYYGQLEKETILYYRAKYHNIILDNVMAFFSEDIEGVDTIYSCRKFFGVPDGAILVTDAKLERELPLDYSYDRMQHLLGRFEVSGNAFYSSFRDNENYLDTQEIKKMSKLTENILRGIDFGFVKKRREENFNYLSENLETLNEININKVPGPYAYPLLLNNKADCIRKKLLEQNYYIPLLWPSMISENKSVLEKNLAISILPLPVDQRYGNTDTKELSNAILGII